MQVMEQESFFSEKSSFANKNYKKYGTTTNNNNLKRNQPHEVLIRHEVAKDDTLQGIALKFGCSMEQIRRANRLFTNDSLFIREFLMIPVNSDSPYYSADSEMKSTHSHMLSKRANTIATSSSSREPFSPNDSIDSISSLTANDDDDQRKFMDDFLEKIDSSIASSKKIVRDHQQNSEYISSSQSDDSLFGSSMGNSFVNHNYDPSGSGTSYQMHPSISHQSARYSLGQTNDTSQLVVRSNGRHVKNSLQKLQKQQDEIFEL